MGVRWIVKVAVAAVAAVGVGLLSAPAAASAAATTLPIPGYGDIAVDEKNQQLFISGGPNSNTVVVTDFLGLVKRSINGLPGVTGLELSADGSQLYAALSAGDAIAVLNTQDFSEVTRYPTGTRTCPTHLARTGNLVWFGYGCEGTFAGRIGRLDPSQPPATAVAGEQQGTVRFQRAPLLASSGAANSPLVAGQLSLSESRVQTYAVTSTRTLNLSAAGEVVGSNLYDLDVTTETPPSLFSASGSRDKVEAFTATTLSGRGAYTVRPRPTAVAVNPANTFVAAGAITPDDGDVLLYRLGSSTPARTIALLPGDVVAPRGLAWSTNLDRLFVISQRNNQTVPSLDVFPLATTIPL